jgi:hypothetical protein
MREVRLAQAGSDKKFIGRNRLSPEQQQAITQAIQDSSLVAAVKESAQLDLVVNRLAERFEEMARRHGMTTDGDLRPSVVKLLATELWVNQRALGVRSERMLSATLHQGAIAPELLEEFPRQGAYVITTALEHAPNAPREFIRRAEENVAALAADPEFQLLAKNRPSELMEVALHHVSDMRGRVRRRQEELKKSRWKGME